MTTPLRRVAIVGATRTPIGSLGGALASLTAPQLGAAASESITTSFLRLGRARASAAAPALPTRLASTRNECNTFEPRCADSLENTQSRARSASLGFRPRK